MSRKTFGKAFRSGYLFAFFYHLFSLYWIGWVTVPGMVAAVAIISLYIAYIFALFAGLYRRRPAAALILFPVLWIGMEYFRSLLEIAFPWSNLSYTQWNYVSFIQICEFVGDLGISLIIVIVNILIWKIWRGRGLRRRLVLASVAIALIAGPTIYGSFALSHVQPESGRPIKVALLQGNVALDIKWDPDQKMANFKLYDSLAASAVPADLLVWPETAAPVYLLQEYHFSGFVSRIAQKVGCPMLVGMLDLVRGGDTTYEYFNAAVQFDADGSHRRPYHKNKLVPFAETVPYARYLPLLANLPVGWSDFTHGRELRVYPNKFGNYGTLICYESIFPELVNQYLRDGADFLVNITNDTWYGYSSGPYQHAVMPIFRAIENRVYIARVANSGFSYFVDRWGRVHDRSRLYERTVLKGTVYPAEKRTLFNRTGPVLGQSGLLLIGIVTVILLGLWIKERT